MTIDVERLRMDLLDYFGTAISYNSLAIIDVAKISNASDEEIVRIALQNGFNLNNYKEKEYTL